MTTQKRPSRFRSLVRSTPFKRVLAVFSIVCTVLYIACWIGEAVNATREKMEGSPTHDEAPKKPLTVRIHENVQGQIEQIKQVNARGLGLTFLYDLKMWNCNWRFHCVPSDASAGYFLQGLHHHDWRQDLLSRSEQEKALGISDVPLGSYLNRGNRTLPPGPAVPGQIWGIPSPKSTDRWNAYTNSIKSQHTQPIFGLPDPTLTPPPGKASAAPLAASRTQPSTSSQPLSGADWQALASAVQTQSIEDLKLSLAQTRSNAIAKQRPVPAPSTPIATQPQAPLTPKADPQPGPDVFSILGVGVNHAAYDEPPTLDEFNYAIHAQEPLLIGNGRFPMPTSHTLLGIPRATFVTIRGIFKAGPWAITIFLACGILYFGVGAPLITILLGGRGKKKWDALPLIGIGLLLISPFAIPNLVGGVQWAAAALGNAVSWMVGLLAIVATWSAAIGVLVGIPHVWKSPREVKEALHVIRHGVEAIEKH